MGRVGSAGSGDPKANTNHSGMHAPNRRVYQAACASIAAMAVSFSGITRPVPPSAFRLAHRERPTSTIRWLRRRKLAAAIRMAVRFLDRFRGNIR